MGKVTGTRADERAPQGDGASKVPVPPSRPWLPALLALLGSSGVISVFGPITGELYWEGYLAAFGLTPEEFAATAARIRVYAYEAIIEGAASVYLNVRGLVPYIFAAVIALIALVLFVDHMRAKRASFDKSIARVAEIVRGDSWWSLVFRSIYVAAAAAISLLIILYMAVTVLVLVIAPMEARKLGLRQGQKELSRITADGKGERCDVVEAANFTPAGCSAVVAFGDKTIAVYSEGKILRLARDSAKVTSFVPRVPASQAAASPSH